MWPLIRIPHLPFLYWTAVVAVCGAHVVLCHRAATCRGFPPLLPEELIACFIAPFFVGVPALFDDRRATRDRGIFVMAVLMGWTYGIVLANQASGRPSIGHLTGMHGVVIRSWFEVSVRAVFPGLVLYAAFYFYERVAGDLWAMVRRFRKSVESDCSQVSLTKGLKQELKEE